MYKSSKEKSKALLQRIAEHLGEGEVRESRQGTPHLVAKGCSVVRFGSSRTFRLFKPWPCPGAQQFKKDFKTYGDVMRYMAAFK